MSAELVDPFAPTHQPPLTPDEVETIQSVIREYQHDDRALIPELHAIGFEVLCAKGVAGDHEATQAVRRMLDRAKFGGPLDEPREPSWSLSPEPHNLRELPWERTLGEDETHDG